MSKDSQEKSKDSQEKSKDSQEKKTRTWYCRLLDPFNVNSLNDIVNDGTHIATELPEIVPFFKIWRQKATALRILHAFLGVSSVFFSLLTTTVLQFEGTPHGPDWNAYAKIFAFIAAVSIGLMTAFNLGTKSNDMTRAWRKLTAAIIRFNEGVIKDKEKVIDEYVAAEKLIGDVTFDQSLVPNHDGEAPGQAPPGQAPPGQAPPGQAPPGQAPPGQAPPGQAPPGKNDGTVPPAEKTQEKTPRNQDNGTM